MVIPALGFRLDQSKNSLMENSTFSTKRMTDLHIANCGFRKVESPGLSPEVVQGQKLILRYLPNKHAPPPQAVREWILDIVSADLALAAGIQKPEDRLLGLARSPENRSDSSWLYSSVIAGRPALLLIPATELLALPHGLTHTRKSRGLTWELVLLFNSMLVQESAVSCPPVANRREFICMQILWQSSARAPQIRASPASRSHQSRQTPQTPEKRERVV